MGNTQENVLIYTFGFRMRGREKGVPAWVWLRKSLVKCSVAPMGQESHQSEQVIAAGEEINCRRMEK